MELTHKSQLLEAELEETSSQLKEATAVAKEEATKCNAAKEVIKSLTAQVSFHCTEQGTKIFLYELDLLKTGESFLKIFVWKHIMYRLPW